MSNDRYPILDHESFAGTRDALHAYAGILGDCLKACREKRKHWWHASLRPSLTGVASGIVRAKSDFALELDLQHSVLRGYSTANAAISLELHGQPAAEVAQTIGRFMLENGVDEALADKVSDAERNDTGFDDYAAGDAARLGRILGSVSAAMEAFRAGIREETSPIQIWPHHFDLSMLWLPGELIAGRDPADEEVADKQMNFGFVFGDEGIPQPYFYVTAYPLPDALPKTRLPAGVEWKSDGFSGAVLMYRALIATSDPDACLRDLWTAMLSAGRQHMLDNPR